MASLAPNHFPTVLSSNSIQSPHTKSSNNIYRHQHSLSTSTPANQHFGSVLFHSGGPRSAGGLRQSLDVSKCLAVNGPISPRPSALNGLRPNRETFSAGHVGGRNGSSSAQLNSIEQSTEAEVLDKWFEDLQSYEATLEEMAAASLDINFKEELNAIEHWFRVLSEAERTAALYSLMQSSTQVQIRFFITVLQQMARSDPMVALLSPAVNVSTPSMEQQMEAKLSQLSMKSPASPVGRHFAHQSLSSNFNVPSNDNFLSPNAALFSESGNTGDAANALCTQRAKLGVMPSNRLSAPGSLLAAGSSLKSPQWGNLTIPVEDESQSRNSSSRSHKTSNELGHSQTPFHPTFTCTVQPFDSGIESQLSPIMGGSWASQVNTPLVPMFSNNDTNGKHNLDDTTKSLADATNHLVQWGAAHQAGSNGTSAQITSSNHSSSRPPANGFPLDDPRKYRRQSKVAGASGSHGFLRDMSGASSNISNMSSAQSINNANTAALNNTHHANSASITRSTTNNKVPLLSSMSSSSSLGAQQAAVAAQQNWRNGLNSASIPQMNNTDSNMLNNLGLANTLAAGLNSGMNLNGMANLAAMANISDPTALQNMANLLNMRQQVQQVQNLQSIQQQLQQSGILGAGILTPHSARFGMNFAFPKMTGSPGGISNRRSPGGRGSGKPIHVPGSGSNPEEELDMHLLNDVPAWLRGLRLHKYTPNFAGCTWQEMILMSDATLEARGVAAVGARRKMLRTFETVRIIKGMALPGDGIKKSPTPTSTTQATSADQSPTRTNNVPTQSDKDAIKNDSPF